MAFLADIGAAFQGPAAAMGHWGQHQFVPALGEVAKAANTFGKEKLGPALAETGRQLDDFGRTKLGPALGEAGKHLDDFGRNILAPALWEGMERADHFGQHEIAPILIEVTQTLDEFGKNKLGPALSETCSAIDEFGKKKLGPALEDTGEWIKEHPGQTFLIATSVATLAAPGLFTSPVLWVFGFGGQGVAKGSAAAAIQSLYGNVATKSAFATAQSAGAGGYGVAVVHGLARIGSAISGVAGFLSGQDKIDEKEGTDDTDEKET